MGCLIFSLQLFFYQIKLYCIKQRKEPMAKQTAKQTATKRVVAKKTIKKVTAPAVEHAHCCCEHKCGCKCHHGKVLKKIVLFVIIFALGFASAKLCCCHKKYKMMPQPEFDNGCLVVKCPKMVSMMDADKNGCVSVEEFKAAKKHAPKHDRKTKRHPRPQGHAPMVAE